MKGYEILYEHYKEYNRPEHYIIWFLSIMQTKCPYHFDSRFDTKNYKCEFISYTDENFNEYIEKDCPLCWRKALEREYEVKE